MKTATAHPLRHPITLADQPPLRLRAELPALAAWQLPDATLHASHDFLVPNPRPDLTTDSHRALAVTR